MKYCIANTTREERMKKFADAKAINSLGCEPLTPDDEALFQRHIDGELEIEEIIEIAINKYKQ